MTKKIEKNEKQNIKTLVERAAGINEYLRNAGIKEETKGYLVSALVFTIVEETLTNFNEEIKKREKINEEERGAKNQIEITYGKILFEQLEVAVNKRLPTDAELEGTKEEKKIIKYNNERNFESRKVMLNSFSFLKTLTALQGSITETSGDVSNPIKKLFKEIQSIKEDFGFGKEENNIDLLGVFYQEFTKYNSGDGNGLGIVLTPTHICDIMAGIIEANKEDTILDLCTGSTSLLMAALNEVKKTDKEGEFNINKQLIGVEFSDQLFTMAMINLLIRKRDGEVPRLISGSCFKQKLSDKKPYPNKLIINPPYSQCKSSEQKELHELNFLKHGLNSLDKGDNAKGTAIFPASCFTKSDKVTKEFKKQLLENHTLEAVITMPDQVFYPVGTCTVVSLWSAGVSHPKDKEVIFYDFKDDGYEIDRKESRAPRSNKEALELSEELIKCIKTGNLVKGKSVKSTIKDTDEWVYEAFRPTEMPTEEDFSIAIKERLLFDMKENLDL